MFAYFDYEEPVFRPPSEAYSLILQATIGCSQNHCGFCGMYKMKRFRVRPLGELLAEIGAIPAHHRPHIQRVFLADGDALILPQEQLLALLAELAATLPNLNRVGVYASPNSLESKTPGELEELREHRLRMLYFGLESGDDATLRLARKGFAAAHMAALCHKALEAGMKLSVTAILGLAGRQRSREHALATAAWVNEVSPQYFSLLTLFRRHNDAFFAAIQPLTNGQIIEEALTLVSHLSPRRTILRSNHISNSLNLAGSYPKDRERIIAQARLAREQARRHPAWCDEIPDYGESYF